jgi:hypothetical protein
MGNGLLRLPWASGPTAPLDGPVLISVTDFRLAKVRKMPGEYLAAMRLRHAWPQLQGAVGMWLWAQPLARRSGAVSVWQDEEDLRRFVNWPVHVAIMRKYRDAGKLTSTSWTAERFIAAEVWQEATRLLAANVELS